MAPMTPRLRILSVGGNAVSAFLSWRLQATNACDVTLVWKNNYETVSQYGIAFQSVRYGNQRFKPRHVVPTVEKAAEKREGAFDYVILSVKALPDVYDLASVIDAVVTPQHTCILLNTTSAIGLEAAIEERFPTNVVLSIVSGAELSQLSSDTFEHKGETPEVWVGPATKNPNIPPTIQEDMAQALAMTLSTGEVDCKVSSNIQQQQFDRVIGPIAFHPLTVLFDTPNYAALLQKVGVQQMVSEVIDEMLALATAQGCKFPSDFKDKTIEKFTTSTAENTMYQDFILGRPMEIETYLGSPLRLSKETNIKVPRIETLYSLIHHLNQINRGKGPRPAGGPPPEGANGGPPHARMSTQGPLRSVSNGMNGMGPNGMGPNGMPPRGGRPRGSSQLGPPGARRPPPVSMHGGSNGYGRGPPMPMPNGSRQPSRRGSMEDTDLGEFSHLVLYDDIPEGGEPEYVEKAVALKEREMQLRERELRLREQEARSYRGGPPHGPGPRRGPPPPPSMRGGMYDDLEDDDDDWLEPSPLPAQMVDENFDMMSVTSRKNRKIPSSNAAQFRKNAEQEAMTTRGSRFRPNFGRNRSSQIVSAAPMANENILDDALIGYSSNRYGSVDRAMMHAESRANSLTASHLGDVPYGGPPHMGPNGMNGYQRRISQSPAHPYSPSMRGGGNGRPSPPNGYPGPHMNGRRPSPPDGVRQPVPQHPPGHGNVVAPQRVEQYAGVSALHVPKPQNNRSLTGSASASAGSGDSHLESEPSAHSSQSSLGPRPPLGVR